MASSLAFFFFCGFSSLMQKINVFHIVLILKFRYVGSFVRFLSTLYTLCFFLPNLFENAEPKLNKKISALHFQSLAANFH